MCWCLASLPPWAEVVPLHFELVLVSRAMYSPHSQPQGPHSVSTAAAAPSKGLLLTWVVLLWLVFLVLLLLPAV